MAPYDDERERPSWREIDRRRDRSRHTSRHREPLSRVERALKSPWLKQKYMEELEKLFSGKKGTKEHQKLYEAIHKTYGSNKFHRTVERYIQEYGLPEDWGTLILLLDHKKPEIVRQALEALKGLYPQKGLVEKQGFISKVKIIALTAEDDLLRADAETTLEEINSL
ncbi:hypothetical protein [Thermosulfuriphilus sp.]